ncbi:hypothetical protein CLF_103905 [Clonorchis sinensis]|uniref:Uncharacterized protein n=1 Tax=Clonorchis sinensis TaxID=79923 RepID=G7YAL3_CLOSI|nr:hypothetical protein CLF_103905 [Clonorchis sinensis]
MDILHEEFGSLTTAGSFTNGIMIRDATDIPRKLAREMNNIGIALKRMRYSADLNCSTDPKGIVRRLPRHFHHEWAGAADNGIRERKEPPFRQFISLIEACRQCRTFTGSYPTVIVAYSVELTTILINARSFLFHKLTQLHLTS